LLKRRGETPELPGDGNRPWVVIQTIMGGARLLLEIWEKWFDGGPGPTS